MIFGLVTICLGLGFGSLLIFGVDEADKIMVESINRGDDHEFDYLSW